MAKNYDEVEVMNLLMGGVRREEKTFRLKLLAYVLNLVVVLSSFLFLKIVVVYQTTTKLLFLVAAALELPNPPKPVDELAAVTSNSPVC